jgi:flagellar export protein FliJ
VTKQARLKLLGRVKDARQRLRDAAAGELAVADAEMAEAVERRSDAAAELTEVKEGVVARLAEAQTVRALWEFESEHHIAQLILKKAEEEAEKARLLREEQRTHLMQRARELKTAEKVIDKTRAGLRSDERRAEQRMTDDLAGRARRDE